MAAVMVGIRTIATQDQLEKMNSGRIAAGGFTRNV